MFLSHKPELGLPTKGLIPLKQDSRWRAPRCQWARAWLDIKHWSCDPMVTLANLFTHLYLFFFFTNFLIPDILESKRDALQVTLPQKYLLLKKLKMQNGHQLTLL